MWCVIRPHYVATGIAHDYTTEPLRIPVISRAARMGNWLESLKERIASHDFILRRHRSHWHPISTVPYNQDVQLRVVEGTKTISLQFPCRRTNAEEWINADLHTRLEIQPVEWRVWQHSKSASPPG
jgi:hypothetical protein